VGKLYESIDAKLGAWIAQQKMFFVATAPSGTDGLINCSPKGGDSFRILNGDEVAYQDYTGSGIETIAHLRENGRIVIMFCGFEGPPNIVRLYGQGAVITEEDSRYQELIDQFPTNEGTRAIIHVTVDRISDPCGFSVPLYEYRGQRDVLDKWAASKGTEGLKEYRRTKNTESIDGLPGLNSK
jgi:hypothetical protein